MKKNIWEEKLHKSRMESTLLGPGKFGQSIMRDSAFNSTTRSRGIGSARRYQGSTLMNKTGNMAFNKKNSSFNATRPMDSVDDQSNETHPYHPFDAQTARDHPNVNEARDLSAERNQRSRTVEANLRRDRRVYKMPMSRHIGKHAYGKDPGSQQLLKQSMQGDGPVKLEKINHEIRIRQELTGGTAGGSSKRSNRASLPPLQVQEKYTRRAAGRAQVNRQSSPSFPLDRASTSPPADKAQRRNKTAAHSGAVRSPNKRSEALLFQI